jgi:hypothetical protein
MTTVSIFIRQVQYVIRANIIDRHVNFMRNRSDCCAINTNIRLRSILPINVQCYRRKAIRMRKFNVVSTYVWCWSWSTYSTIVVRSRTSLTNSIDSSDMYTVHALSFPSLTSDFEEILSIFLIGLIIVLILWLTVCCTWFLHCHQQREPTVDSCQLFSYPSLQSKSDRFNRTMNNDHRYSNIVGNLTSQTRTGGLENLSLYINPFENKRISSLKITQINWQSIEILV